jgi:hypothetical protein
MSLIPDSRKGFASSLIRERFGQGTESLSDLVFKMIQAESIIKEIDHSNIVERSIICEWNKANDELQEKINYIKKWYVAYLNFCIKCNNCCYFCEEGYCSLYGKDNMPELDLGQTNKNCEYFRSKKEYQKEFMKN